MVTGLDALLRPRSIAIVGATPRPDSLGGRPALNLAAQGYRGTVYPVNPRYDRIGDGPCYKDLASLPAAPDLVLVLVGADRVFATLDGALAAGAKAAIVFGGGFAEVGGDGVARQQQLAGYGARGLRVCGPNCNGVFNVVDSVAVGFSPSFEQPARKGGLALLSQSGAIATALSSRGMETGIGFSHVVATGNEADLEVADFVEHLLDDRRVTAFACYVEGFRDPARFLRAARMSLRAGKPVVVLKAGRFASGQAVSFSHTGSMTGSYEVLAGAMRQAGVVLASGLEDVLALASVFATGRRPRGGGTAVMSLSGGMASLIADSCTEAGVALAAFAPETTEALRAALPGIAHAANPLDVTGQVVNDPALWTRCATAIAADPGVDATVSLLSILANEADVRVARDVVAASVDLLSLCVWPTAAPPGCGREVVRDAGLPAFTRAEDAVRALAAWRSWWDTRDSRLAAGLGAKLPAQLPPDPWAMLEAAGIPVARQTLVPTRAELDGALRPLRFPLALKIQSADIPHKTELNLLRLGVRTPEDAAAAFETILADARRHVPAARIDGVLLQEMAAGRREFILGLRREPGLGPCVVFGLGGIFSGVMRDIAVRPAPVSRFDAGEMLAELRGAALLGPVRGLGAARPGLLEDVIQRFSTLVLDPAAPAEFEVNPLILADDGQSCTAVDVLAGG